MTVDLSTNSQYTALQQSYDTQLDNISQVKQIFQQMQDMVGPWSKMDPNSQEYKDTQAQYDALANQCAKLDPDLSIRNQINAGVDPAAAVQSQENTALGALATSLFQQDAVAQANAAAQAAGSETMAPDIMTRAMMVMAKLGDATEGVTDGYIDQVNGNVDQISDLNDESQAVRAMRPSVDDNKTTGSLSGADAAKLQTLGVSMPSGVTPDSNGNYNLTQEQCDQVLNGIQSQSSTLTTLNQNTTISMNKSIDVGQQCSTFQSTALQQWAQLMSKILSA